MSGPAAIELPPVETLTERQLRGADCVLCQAHLDNGSAVSLGTHTVDAHGTATSWYPRTCSGCAPATRLEWQWRERGSGGAPYRQRVSVSAEPVPDPGLIEVIKHERTCTACQVRTDGAYCPKAAELIRAAREARR
ncbi:hypothetical protein [Streptomyces sp. NPDC058653]|uniref:hypothetical protein n=1 Tax=Streptomyces sp. NPDC058653 TaxID=3346576 RepID=UPI00366A0D68